jgi:hypothetical protein
MIEGCGCEIVKSDILIWRQPPHEAVMLEVKPSRAIRVIFETRHAPLKGRVWRDGDTIIEH